MHRLPDDCRQMFIRLQGRKHRGRFTPEEDRRVVSCVRRVSDRPPDECGPIHDLPVSGLPWTRIASLMNNERLPLDYLRRWQIIMKHANNNSNKHIDNTVVPRSRSHGRGIDGEPSAPVKNLNVLSHNRSDVLTRRIALLEKLQLQ